ncbi:MAG TPA: SigE family RNA polymerase sigma factor [Dermatophilaceae bacterium]|nr:SigE family RNA polymerase sigma factor [Dermatophilaceae bacterium]
MSSLTGIDLHSLYAAHRLPLVRLAVLLVDDVATAEDVVQDAFVGLARHTGSMRDPNAALAYLRRSVVNGARSTLRRRGTVRRFLARATEPPPEPPADGDVLRADTNREVLDAVRRLPPRMQEVLALRYWSDLTEAQIAHALGISEGTVKSTASRALDRLETLLEGRR